MPRTEVDPTALSPMELVRGLRDPERVAATINLLYRNRQLVDLEAPELVEALLDVVRAGGETAAACADFAPHASALEDAFRPLLSSPMGDEWSPVPSAFAFLAASPNPEHARAALDWFVTNLGSRTLPRFDSSVKNGAATLLGRAGDISSRALAAIEAFLDAGPATTAQEADDWRANAVYRDLFELVAPSLPPPRAWSIVTRALERVDPPWGQHTRYSLLHTELARHAESLGIDALEDVMSAMSEPSIALAAVLAMAASPGLDRERVLARLVPALDNEAITGVPRYCTLAAAAVRALAPDGDPKSLGLPPLVAARWKAAVITAARVCEVLGELGLLDGALAPARARREPLLGSELVHDVLTRARLLHHFDAESGFVPAPYAELLAELASLVRGVAIEVHVDAERKGRDAVYTLTLTAANARATVTFEDGSDYYDVPRVVALFNDLFARLGDPRRFVELATSDQTAAVLCGPPAALRAAASKLGFKLRRAPRTAR